MDKIKLSKDKICNSLNFLLQSAENRNTEQGVFVCSKALILINQADNINDVKDILTKVNKALIGIEAHGYFTNDEYTHVQDLRQLEQELLG